MLHCTEMSGSQQSDFGLLSSKVLVLLQRTIIADGDDVRTVKDRERLLEVNVQVIYRQRLHKSDSVVSEG